MAHDILVFAERREGEIKRPSLEVVSEARRLAGALGGRVEVLALGPGASGCADELAAYGVDRLWAVEAAETELYAAEAYAACMAQAVEKSGASVVLLPATSMGRDVAARVTAKLETACASDLIEVEVGTDGALRGRRPVYSGKAMARVSIPKARPAVATLRPNAFPLAMPGEPKPAEVAPLDSPLPPDRLRVRTVRVERSDRGELDVAEASIIASGGRGLKQPENFSLIRDLAGVLGAAVGASRAVVDAGWIPHAHQVGQTGKVVSPDLYIACGISGAVQHLAGMSSSKIIVAINKDPEAPIFKIADYGIIGDLFQIVPALTEAVRKLKS